MKERSWENIIGDFMIILLIIFCLIATITSTDWRIFVIGATAFGAMCETFGKAERED